MLRRDLGRCRRGRGVEALEALECLVGLLRWDESLVDGRGDDGGCYGVDADLLAGEFDGQVVGEGVQAGRC